MWTLYFNRLVSPLFHSLAWHGLRFSRFSSSFPRPPFLSFSSSSCLRFDFAYSKVFRESTHTYLVVCRWHWPLRKVILQLIEHRNVLRQSLPFDTRRGAKLLLEDGSLWLLMRLTLPHRAPQSVKYVNLLLAFLRLHWFPRTLRHAHFKPNEEYRKISDFWIIINDTAIMQTIFFIYR